MLRQILRMFFVACGLALWKLYLRDIVKFVVENWYGYTWNSWFEYLGYACTLAIMYVFSRIFIRGDVK